MIKEIKRTLKRIKFFTARTMFAKEKRTPCYLGRTFAVGFCAGAFMIYGQTLLCLAVWLIMDRWLKRRFSVLIASLLTFISNPLTTPFILYLYYLTGQVLLGDSAVPFTSFLIQAKSILANIDTSNISDGLRLLALKIGCPIALGSLPWHVVMAFLGYNVGVRVYWRMHHILEKKKISQNERKSSGGQRVSDATTFEESES